MDYDKGISSSEDEFDFSLNEEITSIHTELNNTENESSDNNSDEVKFVRKRKVRIIDSDSEDSSDTAENAQSQTVLNSSVVKDPRKYPPEYSS